MTNPLEHHHIRLEAPLEYFNFLSTNDAVSKEGADTSCGDEDYYDKHLQNELELLFRKPSRLGLVVVNCLVLNIKSV
jgi:hypothetical protein